MYRTYTQLVALALLALLGCQKTTVEKGVTLDLAQSRSDIISDISYSIDFSIPDNIKKDVTGIVDINFKLKQKQEVILDFRNDAPNAILSVLKQGEPIDYNYTNGHIVIPRKYQNSGENQITIHFTSSNGSLNRRDEFLYTLFVPDRASTVFPCFDQPDLKAKYRLSLQVPNKWEALANASIDSAYHVTSGIKRITFSPTQPISTYHFAFTVGNFKVEEKTIKNRTFRVLHRETDQVKLQQNLDILFELHAHSLDWLEEYTGIAYPFDKLDFALIPGFQYGGMEHPGSIFYRDSRLLLDENPSSTERLQQANLIAHEVAHQWFGNLVTMKWFNDVWLKEVFASFMADLIVNPHYPELDHELTFILNHFPRSYSIDRTLGSNPIVQPLDNLLNAGTLYGDIIYHKSPIMMQQLMQIMGDEEFKSAIREYLSTYAMSNATWDELVYILNEHTSEDLMEWSYLWTYKTGRPIVEYTVDDNGLMLTSTDFTTVPPMWVEISSQKYGKHAVWIDTLPVSLSALPVGNTFDLVVNSNGKAYGCFIPEDLTDKNLTSYLTLHTNTASRATFHIALFEMLLEGKIDSKAYLRFLLEQIPKEKEPRITVFLLQKIPVVFWKYSTVSTDKELAKEVENMLWKLLQSSISLEQKRPVFACLSSIFTTDETFSFLYNAWLNMSCYGLTLSEKERIDLALELMIRKPELYHTIAFGELGRISNPDRISQFEFLLRATSPEASERCNLFESLKNASNRKPEPWVVEALQWLHHPLRTDFSTRYIATSLDLLPEIQATGDIFFPKMWLDATLSNHTTPEAYHIVKQWIDENQDIQPNLMQKLLQSADILFRANKNEESNPYADGK